MLLTPVRSTATSGVSFDLVITDGLLPSGYVDIAFRVRRISLVTTATIYFEGSALPTVTLTWPKLTVGKFRAAVRLPGNSMSIRLVLGGPAETVVFGEFSIRRLSRAGFVIAKATNPVTLRHAGRHLARFGIRATVFKVLGFQDPSIATDYPGWIERFDTLSRRDVSAIRRDCRSLTVGPPISIILPVCDPNLDFLNACIESVRSQFCPNWELCITDDASADPAITALLTGFAARDPRIKYVRRAAAGGISSAANDAIALAVGDFLAILNQHDLLRPHAIYMAAREIAQNPDLDMIFSDEDSVDEAGDRHTPNFKPDWSYDLFVGRGRGDHLAVYRTALVRAVGGMRLGRESAADYDLGLRIVEQTTPDRIRHIPLILYHCRGADPRMAFHAEYVEEVGRAAISRAFDDHIGRRQDGGDAVEAGDAESLRVIYPLPAQLPPVSLLVPTRDRLSLLRTCIDGLLGGTDYADLEVVILDNGSREPETLAYLDAVSQDPRVRVEYCPGDFNFAGINNLGAERARGEILGFINNDIEVIEAGWLREMVAHAARPNVGAVGAKLLYPDDTVQHAGVIVGLGNVAGHPFRHIAADDPGYFGRAVITQNLSAVTAACMLTPKRHFFEVGGFDAEHLRVAYNDVDLCLKLRARGYHIVWTPHAVLYHHESASRGDDLAGEKLERYRCEVDTMWSRWQAELMNDPFYNANLSLFAEDFRLAQPPRGRMPWRRVSSQSERSAPNWPHAHPM